MDSEGSSPLPTLGPLHSLRLADMAGCPEDKTGLRLGKRARAITELRFSNVLQPLVPSRLAESVAQVCQPGFRACALDSSLNVLYVHKNTDAHTLH